MPRPEQPQRPVARERMRTGDVAPQTTGGISPAARVGAAAAAAAICITLVQASLGVIAAAALVAAVSATLPDEWDLGCRIFTGVVIATCALMLLAIPGLLLPGPFPVAAAVGVLTGAALVDLLRRPDARRRVRRPTVEGAATAGCTGLVSAVLLRAWLDRSLGGRVAVMLTGEDNAAHLALQAAVRSAGGFLYRVQDLQLSPDLRTYPHGAHVAAVFIGDLLGGSGGSSGAVTMYSLSLLSVYAALATSIVAVSIRLANACGTLPPHGAPLAFFAGTASTLGGPLMFMLHNGFFSQIMAYVVLLCLLVVALDRHLAGDPWRQLALLALLGAGVAATYYLFLPIAGAVAAPVLWRNRTLIASRRARSALVGAVASLGLVPVAASLGSGAASHINAPGPIFTLDRTLIFRFLAVGVVFAAIQIARRRSGVAWIVALGTATLFALALSRHGSPRPGELDYYFEKSLYSVLVLAIVGTTAATQVLLDRDLRTAFGRRFLVPLLSLLVVVLVAQQVSTRSSPVLVHQLEAAKTSPALDAAFALPDEGGDPAVIWHVDTPVSDFIATRMLSGAAHRANERRRRFELDFARSGGADISVLLRYLSDRSHVTVITSDTAVAAEVPEPHDVVLLTS